VEISKPLTPEKIKEILYEKIYPHDIYLAVLMQELIINVSKYISTSPEMFTGIMKLRLSWIVEVMKQELETSTITTPSTPGFSNAGSSSGFGGPADEEPSMLNMEPLSIYILSPNQLKQLLYYILTCNNNHDRTVYQKRQLDGALNRVPINFYEQVWYILNKSPYGIKVYDYHLPQVLRLY
jgi:phosphorylase kinase alpha/beta subunit